MKAITTKQNLDKSFNKINKIIKLEEKSLEKRNRLIKYASSITNEDFNKLLLNDKGIEQLQNDLPTYYNYINNRISHDNIYVDFENDKLYLNIDEFTITLDEKNNVIKQIIEVNYDDIENEKIVIDALNIDNNKINKFNKEFFNYIKSNKYKVIEGSLSYDKVDLLSLYKMQYLSKVTELHDKFYYKYGSNYNEYLPRSDINKFTIYCNISTKKYIFKNIEIKLVDENDISIDGKNSKKYILEKYTESLDYYYNNNLKKNKLKLNITQNYSKLNDLSLLDIDIKNYYNNNKNKLIGEIVGNTAFIKFIKNIDDCKFKSDVMLYLTLA